MRTLSVKTKDLSAEEAKKIVSEVPDRKQGRWKELCDKVKKTGKAVEVTGISRGQGWSLKRTATNEGLKATVLDKGERVIILPPEKKS